MRRGRVGSLDPPTWNDGRVVEFVGWLFVSVIDSILFSGPGASRRAYEAYRDAWKQECGAASEETLPTLREHFKQNSCPGAYADPDGVPLISWVESWRAGLPPHKARRTARRFRPAKA